MGEGKSLSLRSGLVLGISVAFMGLSASAQVTYQPVRLGSFGPTSRGMDALTPNVINSSGLVGGTNQYPPGGFTYLGPTLWPAGGITPVHLDGLGPVQGGVGIEQVLALNDSGLAGGVALLYSGDT